MKEIWDATKEVWTNVKEVPLDHVKERILTNHEQQGFHPFVSPVFENFDSREKMKILDIGCGIGRNSAPLSSNYNWLVTSYDNPEMITKAKDWLKGYSIVFSSDWEEVNSQKFDLVFSTLVFQHIPHYILAQYANDICKMTNNVFLHGRRYNDYGGNTWEIVLPIFYKNGFKDTINPDFTIQGDPHGHDALLLRKNDISS